MNRNSNHNNRVSLSKFESMLKTNNVYFFDSTEFEEIIQHYLDSGRETLAHKAINLGLEQHPGSVSLKILLAELFIYEDKFDEADIILTALHAIERVLAGKYNYEMVTMAETELNDGQKLLAFNDFFIGPSSHTSARYEITFDGHSENHSSSGIIVSTGAGSTGWLSSLFNMANSIHQTFGNIQAIP